jgi:hypothetical protein
VEEELAVAVGLVVLDVALGVLVDVGAANERARSARPARSDFTSVPVSAMPASKRSSRW